MEEKKDGFVVIHEFMWKDLGLSGVALLVFARVFGFCRHGSGDFYESKARTAAFFGVNERTVFRAMKELIERDLLVEVGTYELGSGRKTKAYRVCQAAIPDHVRPPGETPWESQPSSGESPEENGSPSGKLPASHLADCHPIQKKDNKAFERIGHGD